MEEAEAAAHQHLFPYDAGAGPSTSRKVSLEWDLNDWKWDGHLFVATPLNDAALLSSECRRNKQLQLSNSFLSPSSGDVETTLGKEGKRKRIAVVEDEDHYYDRGQEGPPLALNLGGNAYPALENDDKRTKLLLPGGAPSRAPCCQVEGCGADLRESKDYHRRHKVCELHSKATAAVVNSVPQRFCQQCSRFHLLEEFDEGKRSCRRRLAGHNRRRRKNISDASTVVNPMINDQATGYLLISLLRVLANMHSDSPDQSNDQDLLTQLLNSLATLAGSFNAKNIYELLQASQDLDKHGASAGTSSGVPNGFPIEACTTETPPTPKITCATSTYGPSVNPVNHSVCVPVASPDISSTKHLVDSTLGPSEERVRMKEFNLNNAYLDTENNLDVNDNSASPGYLGTGSPVSPSCLLQNSHHSSPQQVSVNSGSTSAQSRSSFNGDAQSQTDRIVFKLFGKDPNDFPVFLRSQILDWLSHSPTDIESYIRPGCVILTIYLHLADSSWEELCSDLSCNLNRLLFSSTEKFWRTGWVYTRIRNHIAFIYDGKVLVSTPRLLDNTHSKIISISPIAVALSSRVSFTVRGLNLAPSSGRLLCAFEGKYLVQETSQVLVQRIEEDGGFNCLSFSCSLPDVVGRGFIEVEDCGLNSCFFPFIVAEDEVCSEIRGLENVIDVISNEEEWHEETNMVNPRSQAMYFLNELGWLLGRTPSRFTSNQETSHPGGFSLSRFKWLLTFALDHEWCAVIKKLLDLLFQGTVDVDGISPDKVVLSEGLLLSAVRKNCRPMVEFLLRYKPDSKKDDCDSFLFRPDVSGPSGITPLHVVTSVSGTESILDALTNDPGQFGLKAWKTARDMTGMTPEEYARSRGHESYLLLVQKKIDKQAGNCHVVLDMPRGVSTPSTAYKHSDIPKYDKSCGFEMDQKGKSRTGHRPSYCSLCSQQILRRPSAARRSLLYRPAMLSMVGIAAVCVCVGILFKGPPEVCYVFHPFTWEGLGYGSS